MRKYISLGSLWNVYAAAACVRLLSQSIEILELPSLTLPRHVTMCHMTYKEAPVNRRLLIGTSSSILSDAKRADWDSRIRAHVLVYKVKGPDN